MRPVRTLTAGLLVALLAVTAACSSPEEKAAGHLAKAEALFKEENWTKAGLEAKNAVQLQPKNAEAHLILAKLAWRAQKFPEAFTQLQLAVESDPKLLEAHLRLGDLFFSVGDAKAAAEQVKIARELAPDRADVHLLGAKVLYLQGDKAGAAKEIDLALEKDPAYTDAYTARATLLAEQKDVAGAIALIDKGIANTKGDAAELLRDFRLAFILESGDDAAYETAARALIAEFPKQTKYRYRLVDFYANRNRPADEERELRALIAADPESHEVKIRLAGRLLRSGDAAGAEQVLKDGVAKYPDSADLKLALGDFYRAQKRSKEAMATYREAAARWSETSAEGQAARNRIVAQLTVDGDIKQARADIEMILKAAPDNADALFTRATFAFLDRKYDDAIADLRAVLRRDQLSSDAELLLARAYVGSGDLVVAKDTYRTLVARDPGNGPANKELAVLLSGEGDSAQAAEILKNFVALKPDDPEASAALVQSLIAQKDLTSAEAEARRAMEQKSGGALAEQQLARVLQAQGSSAEAIARYRAALDKDPNQIGALEGLTNALLDTGRAKEAVELLTKYPADNLDVALLLGKAHLRSGDAAAARAVHEKAIAIKPDDARAYLALAALEATDSPAQAAALERGHKAVPGDPGVAVFLGSLYERKGRTADAVRVYDAALRQRPGEPILANNLAALLLEGGDKAGLARALELARPFGTSADPVLLDTLGWAQYRNGDVANAVRTLERAVAADGNLAVAQYHLGKAYAAASNPVSARQHLNLAVEKGGSEGFAADAKKELAKLGT